MRLGGIGTRIAERSSSAPGSRRASTSSVTCSAAARRRRSTGCSRRASASRPSTRSHDGDFGKMVALQGTDIVRVPIEDGVAELKTRPDPSASTRPRCFFG